MPQEEDSQMIPAPAPKPQGIIASTPQTKAIVGGPATGKTQILIDHAVQLISGGADPSQLLVFTATPDAASAFKARLINACPAARTVCVVTPREWYLELLDTPEAQAHTGRDARLLAPFEYDFLMEDLKVSGIRARRLREMMKFFYKSMTELCDDAQEEWLITQEEISVFHMFKECLGFSRGIIEPELANLAVRFLQANPVSKAKAQVAHVIVDDYQMLSRASQMAANLIARDSIAIACDREACVEVFESYPYVEGLEEFLDANPTAEHIAIDKSYSCIAAGRAVNLLRSDMAIVAAPLTLDECEGSEQVHDIVALEPAHEMEAVSSYVSQLLSEGMNPGDVVIASPHRTWSRNLARALQAQGVAAEQSYEARIASGDIRALDKCVSARVLTALYLAANPYDGVAWRSWCGFGDWLTNSNSIFNLRDFGGRHGMAIDAALKAADDQMDVFTNADSAAGMQRLTTAYDTALAIRDQAQNLTGRPLLEFLARSVLGEGAEVPKVLLQLTAEFADGRLEGHDAQAMAKRAQARLNAPRFECDTCVRITTYKRMAGLAPKVLLLCGFVNGFFPIRDYFDRVAMPLDQAERQHERDTRLLCMVAAKPTQTLAVSRFEQTQLETAEMLKLKLHRIRLKDKKRVALTEPSEFLARLKV